MTCRAAIDALADLDVDRSRVVTIGHSAGGHLAAWAATRENPRVAVTGVVSQAGVLDLQRARELRLSDGVVDRFLGGADTAVASPIERLPLGVPTLLTHGGRDDNVPLEICERFARGLRRDAARRARRGPLRPPRPGQPAVEGGDRMALTRDEAAQLDRDDPLAEFRERFVITDEHRLYLDGNSLGRLPKGTRERLHRVIDQWGDELVSGWPEWIEAPTRTGDALAQVLGAEPGRGARHRQHHGQPLQARQRAARRRPVAAHAGHRPRELPHRPLRARGHRPRARPASCTSSTRPTRCTARSRRDPRGPDRALARRLPLAARWPTWRRSTRAARSSGTSATRPERSRSSSHARGIRYAVGCTYKYLNAGPGAAGYLYVREPDALRTPIQGWFGQDDQFAMERPVLARARDLPLPGRHAADPRAGGGRGGRADHGRGRDRGAAREVDRADRADDRAARRVAGAARLHARLAARPARGAARTSRSTTPRRGRSAAR